MKRRHFLEMRWTLWAVVPPTAARGRSAIDLRFDLRSALMPLGDFARTLDTLRDAEVLAKELNDARRLGRIAASMTNLYWEMGDQDRAIRSGRRALDIAAAVEDGALRDMALRYLGCSYYAIGDYKGAIDVFKQVIGPRDGAAAASDSAPRPAVDRTTVTRVFLMLCLAEVGEFAEAIMCGEELLQIAQAIDNPFNLCAAQSALGRVHLHRGDFGKAAPLLENAFEICKTANIPLLFHSRHPRSVLSRARTHRGSPAATRAGGRARYRHASHGGILAVDILAEPSALALRQAGSADGGCRTGSRIRADVPGARAPGSGRYGCSATSASSAATTRWSRRKVIIDRAWRSRTSSGCARCRRDVISPTESCAVWLGAEMRCARLCRRRSSSRRRWI